MIEVEVEEAYAGDRGYVVEIVGVVSTSAFFAGNAIVTILMDILHSRHFDIDTLESSIKWISNSRRMVKMHTAQMNLQNVLN